MIWLVFVLFIACSIASMLYAVDNFDHDEKGLGWICVVLYVIFVVLALVAMVVGISPTEKCKVYREKVGENGKVTIRLCGDKEIQLNSKTYRGPG